jgi:hypothetical protein
MRRRLRTGFSAAMAALLAAAALGAKFQAGMALRANEHDYGVAIARCYRTLAFACSILAVVWSLIWLAQYWRDMSRLRQRWRATAEGRCADCGYDLRVSTGRCPECGATRSTAGTQGGDSGSTRGA